MPFSLSNDTRESLRPLTSGFARSLSCHLYSLACLISSAGYAAEPGQVEIRWWGHAMVSVETSSGMTIVFDPYGPHLDAYKNPDVSADLVVVSHNHSDHNGIDQIDGNPVVLKGVEEGVFQTIDLVFAPSENGAPPQQIRFSEDSAKSPPENTVRIQSIDSYHDPEKGGLKGHNAMFLMEVGDLRILHMGDIGQERLTQQQIDRAGRVDLLMIPVGGHNTVDAGQASAILDQLRPRQVLPMHFWVEGIRLPLDPLERFWDRLADHAELNIIAENRFTLEPLDERGGRRTQVVVLKPPLRERPADQSGIVLPTELLADYVGEYTLGSQFVISVTLEGDRLFAQPTGQAKVRLFAESESTFFLTVAEARFSFERDEAGEVTNLTLHQGERVTTAPRRRE